MAEHTTEIRFATAEGEQSSVVWRDCERPLVGDIVRLDWPSPLSIRAQKQADAGYPVTPMVKCWLCCCGSAAHTFEQGRQVITISVIKLELATTRGEAG